MRKLIRNFASKIAVKNQYSKEEEEQIEYALRVVVFETLKISGVIFIFSLLRYAIIATVAVGTMALVKPFIGGYHEDSQTKCFIAALAVVGAAIYLSINLDLDIISRFILSGLSMYCIWNQAPVVHTQMAITKAWLIKRNRNVGLFLTVTAIFISFLLSKYNSASNVILWMIVFQAMLLFNKRKKC